jgi:hypothetical protein
MEQQFIHLRQRERLVEEYAVEFLRLSRFAPNLVKEEEERADRFQQGLRLEIQKHLASQELETYDKVLTAARRVEIVTDKDNKNKQQKPAKRTFDQMNRGQAPRNNGPPPAPKQLPPPLHKHVICNYCNKPGHVEKVCRMALGLCLICGSADHQAAKCPSRIHRSSDIPNMPIYPALPAPPAARNT